MKTPERIVEAAIRQFNAQGITQASLRTIADDLGISHGNLAYHYANKGAILEVIYDRMEQEMDDAVYPGGVVTLAHYDRLIRRISAFHDTYRFFYLDILEIARQYPRVIRRYRRTIARRFDEHDRLMADLVASRVVQPEPVAGLYRSLFHSIWVMSTFWLQHKKILGDRHPAIGEGSDVERIWEIMLPHLTPRGLREYRSLASNAARPIATLYLGSVR